MAEYLNNRKFEVLISRFQQVKKEKIKYGLLLEDIQETQHRTAIRKKYQKPENWEALEKIYHEVQEEFESLQNELAISFYLLTENIVRYRKFNLIDPDDAIQEGVMICFEKLDKFDTSKGKAFNYLTTVLINQLRQLYRSAHNYNQLKENYSEFMRDTVEIPIISHKTGNIVKNENVSFRY